MIVANMHHGLLTTAWAGGKLAEFLTEPTTQNDEILLPSDVLAPGNPLAVELAIENSFGDRLLMCLQARTNLANEPADQMKNAVTSLCFFENGRTTDSGNTPQLLTNADLPIMRAMIITLKEVREELAKLDTHKPTGPDGLPSALLQPSVDVLVGLLTYLFKASVKRDELPQDWNVAGVNLIYRGGSRSSLRVTDPLFSRMSPENNGKDTY
ncbi:hypothetical protein EG68_00468 [Paragonimus skrjabini miyazakii]|uniref:Uncharacterized protein n=1 Tax=Paragonimus skrjabini miyazakii TaxID=59628 RepID=A0A8S9ZAB8_9TREM|nr:hypothetical protein EG68_00468 [Paragonimus skrjabini miyazakii]